MAACGLIPGRQESLLVEDDEESFLGHNLATMVFFASAMSDVLTRINETSSLSTDFQLRIGKSTVLYRGLALKPKLSCNMYRYRLWPYNCRGGRRPKAIV